MSSNRELRNIEKLFLAAQGKCHIVRPYPRCHVGKFPFCKDGKTSNVNKFSVRCRNK